MRSQRVRFRVDLSDRCSIGEGKIALLEAIDRCGSISQAARDLGMSYRRAWLLLRSLNVSFDTLVVTTRGGGSDGGGASVTKFGRELIQAFRDVESVLTTHTAERMRNISQHVASARGSRKASSLEVQREKLSRTPSQVPSKRNLSRRG